MNVIDLGAHKTAAESAAEPAEEGRGNGSGGAPAKAKVQAERAAGPEAPRDERAPARTPPSPDLPEGPPRWSDLNDPQLYLNRELTWLNFNFRVLSEAEDPRTPLLERIKFVAIVSSNLDEFFMKRIGGLKQQVGAGVHEKTPDGRTPVEQIAACQAAIHQLELRKTRVLESLLGELDQHGIRIAGWDELSDELQQTIRAHYLENIFPLVTPQSVDPAHPFPFISNLSLNLLVSLYYPKDDEPLMARVKVPIGAGIPRYVRVPGPGPGLVFIKLEDVMANNLDLLFPGMDISNCELFRVTRNAITELDEEQADDLLSMIETELRERKFAPIVRLQVGSEMTPYHRGKLAAELGLDEASDVFEAEGMLAQRDLWELALLDLPELRDPPHHPVNPPDFIGDRSIFHVIRGQGSVLVHHPYESFAASVERFVREAAVDPKVRAIKMTLYRTSSDSAIIKHLITAARNGKQVAVVLELKARFDEEANIRWASRLEQVGIHVTYGVVGLKTHCKVTLVVRQDYDGLRRYAHIGTGNYHSGTARLYTDFSLFTADPQIGKDLTELFNYLTTGYKPRRHYGKLLPSPKILKQALLGKIQREMDHQKAGRDGLIQMKMNALEDVDIVKALYRASQAGVKIDLIVRDTCRIRPGLPGLSETVRVISIVGRFLEHPRIFYFHNGGDGEYFLGSPDLMQRNLESRVETVVPVEDPRLQAELRIFLDIQLGDQRSAWDMQPDGSYVQRAGVKGKRTRGAQRQFIERALRKEKEATRLRKRKAKGAGARNR